MSKGTHRYSIYIAPETFLRYYDDRGWYVHSVEGRGEDCCKMHSRNIPALIEHFKLDECFAERGTPPLRVLQQMSPDAFAELRKDWERCKTPSDLPEIDPSLLGKAPAERALSYA